MTNFYLTLYYISTFIWLIVPFRNWNNKHFYFFLFLVFPDPIILIKGNLLGLKYTSNQLYFIFSFLMLVGLEKDFFKKNLFVIIPTLIPIFILSKVLTVEQNLLFVEIAEVIFLVYFTSQLVGKYFKSNYLHIFYIVLVFYESLNVLKFINVIRVDKFELIQFTFVAFTQLLIGIYLAIWGSKDHKIKV